MLAQSHTQRDSVEPSLPPAREEVTNSERGQVLNSRLKNTFLEFLIQRKKRLPKKEKSPSKPNP